MEPLFHYYNIEKSVIEEEIAYNGNQKDKFVKQLVQLIDNNVL